MEIIFFLIVSFASFILTIKIVKRDSAEVNDLVCVSGDLGAAYMGLQILEREKISIQNLAENIDLYVKKYDTYGSEEEFGNRSHKAFINALKRFQDFCK